MKVQATDRFSHRNYLVRTKILKIFGGSFDIYDPDGDLVLFASQKAFKLKEDIRLYSDKSKSEELLTIKTRNIIDFGASYEVDDTASGRRLGSLKRRGWKSIARDEWILMDATDKEIGRIREDSALLGALRRVMSVLAINLIPQNYSCEIEGEVAWTFRQNFNPFVRKIAVEFHDNGMRLDKRVGLAAAVLLCAIEGKEGQGGFGI